MENRRHACFKVAGNHGQDTPARGVNAEYGIPSPSESCPSKQE